MARNDWNRLPGIIRQFHRDSALTNEQIIRGTAIKLFGAVSDSTPVDEGITRGNWYATTVQPSVKFNEAQVNRNKGEAEFASELSRDSNLLGKRIYLTNNSPNILVLENGGYTDANGNPANGEKTVAGYSKQAPQGMVRVNVMRFQRILDEARDEST